MAIYSSWVVNNGETTCRKFLNTTNVFKVYNFNFLEQNNLTADLSCSKTELICKSLELDIDYTTNHNLQFLLPREWMMWNSCAIRLLIVLWYLFYFAAGKSIF